jgi:hypothetical protein
MAKSEFTATRIEQKAQYDLPPRLCKEIGRITVAWAHFEQVLRATTWELASVDPSVGRLVVRDPRAKQQIEMIRDLVALKFLTLDEAILKSLLATVEAVSNRRDLITHGIWTFIREFGMLRMGSWWVLSESGNWPKQKIAPEQPLGSRKITPEGVRMDVEQLKELLADVRTLIDATKKLRASIRAPRGP